MIGIESFRLPCSRFTTLNAVVRPASAQHSRAMTNRKMTTAMDTRFSTVPNGRNARSTAITRVIAPHT